MLACNFSPLDPPVRGVLAVRRRRPLVPCPLRRHRRRGVQRQARHAGGGHRGGVARRPARRTARALPEPARQAVVAEPVPAGHHARPAQRLLADGAREELGERVRRARRRRRLRRGGGRRRRRQLREPLQHVHGEHRALAAQVRRHEAAQRHRVARQERHGPPRLERAGGAAGGEERRAVSAPQVHVSEHAVRVARECAVVLAHQQAREPEVLLGAAPDGGVGQGVAAELGSKIHRRGRRPAGGEMGEHLWRRAGGRLTGSPRRRAPGDSAWRS